MEYKPQVLRLIYKYCEKKLYFYPNNYEQLREYFLSIFSEKSSEKYIFKSYPDKDTIITFNERTNYKEGFEQIIILKKPAIFVYNENKENNLDEIDNLNIEYIKKNLGFETYGGQKNYERIKKNIEKRYEILKKLEKRINFLNEGINILNIPKIETINDLVMANQKLKEKRNEINMRIEEMKGN